jgi:streptogramin lyase
MKLSKWTAIAALAAFLTLCVSVGVLLAQELSPEPRLAADGSIVTGPAPSSASAGKVLPPLTGRSSDAGPGSGTSAPVIVTEYAVPVEANNLLVNPTGEVWFASFSGNALGVLDLTTREVSVHARHADNGSIWAIKQDPAGDLWYGTVNALPQDVLGKFAPDTKAFVEWSVAAPLGSHFGLDLDPSTGDVWIATRGGTGETWPGFYRLTPATNSVTAWSTYPYTTTYDLDINPDGGVWLTVQPEANQGVIRLNPDTGAMTAWTLPITNGRPFRLFAVSANEVWLTELAPAANSIARLTPSTNTLDEYLIPTPSSYPGGLLVHADKAWFTEYAPSAVGRLDLSSASPMTTTVLTPITWSPAITTTVIAPSSYQAATTTATSIVTTTLAAPTVTGAFTEIALPAGGLPFGIALDPSGRSVWFAETTGRIGRVAIGSERVYLPAVLR